MTLRSAVAKQLLDQLIYDMENDMQPKHTEAVSAYLIEKLSHHKKQRAFKQAIKLISAHKFEQGFTELFKACQKEKMRPLNFVDKLYDWKSKAILQNAA